MDIAILLVIASAIVGGPLLITSWTERQARHDRPAMIREQIIRLSTPDYEGFVETLGVGLPVKLTRRGLKQRPGSS
jgi:hypothetical protein